MHIGRIAYLTRADARDKRTLLLMDRITTPRAKVLVKRMGIAARGALVLLRVTIVADAAAMALPTTREAILFGVMSSTRGN